jgi:hypothetical protein
VDQQGGTTVVVKIEGEDEWRAQPLGVNSIRGK